jgi:hypothetical protein
METLSLSNKQRKEICENVGRMLVKELDSEDVWKRVEKMLVDYLKNNGINMYAADLTEKLELSVKVKIKK